MMQLPALDVRERAYLQASQPDAAARAFAARLRQRLVASLGVPASVSEAECGDGAGLAAGPEPAITIAPELAAAWLALRLGGRPGSLGMPLMDGELVRPFRVLIRRALAESVVNAGVAIWPQRLRLGVTLGGRQGEIEIFWDSAHAMAWARRTIRERT